MSQNAEPLQMSTIGNRLRKKFSEDHLQGRDHEQYYQYRCALTPAAKPFLEQWGQLSLAVHTSNQARKRDTDLAGSHVVIEELSILQDLEQPLG